jgi:hypothetical protein
MGSAVGDLLVEAGIITNPEDVSRVTLMFDPSEVVTAIVTQFVDRPAVETIIKHLRVIDE